MLVFVELVNSFVSPTRSCLDGLIIFLGMKHELKVYDLEVMCHMSDDTVDWLAWWKRAEWY